MTRIDKLPENLVEHPVKSRTMIILFDESSHHIFPSHTLPPPLHAFLGRGTVMYVLIDGGINALKQRCGIGEEMVRSVCNILSDDDDDSSLSCSDSD
jgi:hypothetical protein